MHRQLPVLAAAAALALLGLSDAGAAPAAGGDTPAYKVAARQHIDGATRWDYLSFDYAARQLYLTHGDAVEVFDVASNAVVARITDVQGVHGVALAPALDRGFASNGRSDSVTIFALTSHKTIGSVPTEKGPDAIVFDPASQRVFAMNGKSGSVTAINAIAGTAIKSLPLGGRPEFAAADGKGRLFVNLEDKNSVVVIDTTRLAVTARYDLSAVCDEPAGLSIDAQRQVLFVGCHNQKMVIVDANSGKVIDSLPIGKGSDATLFDAGTQRAFSANGDGTLNVIVPGKNGHYVVAQNLITMRGARTMALDPRSHALYLLAAEVDHVDTPTAQAPHPRPTLKADSLTLLTVLPQ